MYIKKYDVKYKGLSNTHLNVLFYYYFLFYDLVRAVD